MKGPAIGAAVLAIAVGLAVGSALASSDRAARPAATVVWVGTIKLEYIRRFNLASGSTELRQVNVSQVSRPDGTSTVTGKRSERNEYLGTCMTTRSVVASGTMPARPPRVSFAGRKYRIDYANPSLRAVVTHTEGCRPPVVTRPQIRALDVGIEVTGTASPDARVISGAFKNDSYPCAAPTSCTVTQRASWSLRRVEIGDGGQGGGGGGGAGGGGGGGGGGDDGDAAPGAGCERNPRNGTSGDDTLTGSGRADLLRGLAGNDRVRGLAGPDCLLGQRGKDALLGGLGNDRLTGGAGVDTFDGGSGKDYVDARDGTRETVRCGPGRDTARVDAADETIGCEQANRP